MNIEMKNYIFSQRELFISDLTRLVNIKSVRSEKRDGMPFGEGAAKALETAGEILSEHGFCMTSYDNYAGDADLGENPTLAILAHLDVVDEGDGWTKNPYKAELCGNRLYGRGTTDDKGAAVAAIYAMEAVRRFYPELKGGARLILGCAEETGSEDLDYYFSKREKLPFTVSPDADYPIINLEKGRFAPYFSAEIPDGDKFIEFFNGGTTPNIVPGKADALIHGRGREKVIEEAEKISAETGVKFTCVNENGGVRIYSEGVSAHAANPHKGKNAQTALIQLICALSPENDRMADILFSLKELFPCKETDGTGAGVKMSDEKSGALTLNFGVLNIHNGVIRGNLDLRLPLCANEENVKLVLKKKLNAAGLEYENDPKMKAVHFVDENSRLVQTLLGIYEDCTGEKGRCLAIGGGTYVHGIEGGVAFGIEFPGTDYHIHGADEFADIDALLLTAVMYAEAIVKLSENV